MEMASSHLDPNIASVASSTKNPCLVSCLKPDFPNTSTSSTNPHPEEYLNERLAKIFGETDDGAQTQDSIFRFEDEAYLENISLGDLDSNTRVVVAPVTEEALDFSTSYGTAPLRFPKADADVLMITQSSRNADFTLSFSQHTFNFIYDSTSSNLFIRNLSTRSYALERFTTHNGNSQENCQSLLELDACSTLALEPGVWQIGMAGEVFCKLLLVPRRYDVRRGRTIPSAAGSKRVATPLVTAHQKHNYKEGRSISRDYLSAEDIISNDGHLSVVDAGNALASLKLGEFVTVRSNARPLSAPESNVYHTNTLDHPHIYLDVTENYTISHIRNIAVNKDNSSVYRANHSAYGDVAVKVIRRKQASPPSSRAKIAQEWRREELVLRKISHRSIIKLFGSDARFYSLYLEYLPYPDLAAQRHTKAGHFFTGGRDVAVSVLCQIGSALAYLHANLILHNDIKPGNILWAPGRGALLIDFGLATTFTSPACNGGTPFYVPMEYLIGNERDSGSDVFALAVTLLYLLGRIPLPDATEHSWIIAKVSELPKRKRPGTIDKVSDLSDREHMILWLQKINRITLSLGSSDIEGIVKEALTVDPRRRISAEQIVHRADKLREPPEVTNYGIHEEEI
ncbi:Serine/threonine-protein kinase-like protein [Paramyrothecium foliicola]|nr:Serine/threonine-protein kinase-like protein [Paramyrothecium foliicola]